MNCVGSRDFEGARDDDLLGFDDIVGTELGISDGDKLGAADGRILCFVVGICDGNTLGTDDGFVLGSSLST